MSKLASLALVLLALAGCTNADAWDVINFMTPDANPGRVHLGLQPDPYEPTYAPAYVPAYAAPHVKFIYDPVSHVGCGDNGCDIY